MEDLSYQAVVISIFAILNLGAFVMVGMDKKRSRADADRIPEVYLFFIAIFFSSLGVLLGMYYFRHKIRKIYFPLGLGFLLIEQMVLLWLVTQKF